MVDLVNSTHFTTALFVIPGTCIRGVVYIPGCRIVVQGFAGDAGELGVEGVGFLEAGLIPGTS